MARFVILDVSQTFTSICVVAGDLPLESVSTNLLRRKARATGDAAENGGCDRIMIDPRDRIWKSDENLGRGLLVVPSALDCRKFGAG